MSDYPVGSRKNDFTTAPRAFVAAGLQGQVAVLAVSTTAIAVDLTQGFAQAAVNGTTGSDPKTPTRNCLTIQADVDIGIVFGANVAAVSGANAPVIANNGTLTTNTYTGAAGTCWVVKANTPFRITTQPGPDNALGIVATGVGKVRIYQSSPDNA